MEFQQIYQNRTHQTARTGRTRGYGLNTDEHGLTPTDTDRICRPRCGLGGRGLLVVHGLTAEAALCRLLRRLPGKCLLEKVSDPVPFSQARLAVAMGDPGAMLLFGRDEITHRLMAEHLTTEYCVRTEARGRVVDEWKLKAIRPDNHWLDCLVGCAVAASIQGVKLFGTETAEHGERKKRLKLSELARQK